jgi:antitoxin CcdA
MTPPYDLSAPKKATNLSVNSDLLQKAKALGINLSSTMEEALETLVRQRMREQWLAENREAIEDYNRFFAENPVFSQGLRSF